MTASDRLRGMSASRARKTRMMLNRIGWGPSEAKGKQGIEIDAEFQSLIPPLSADEHAALETSLLSEGCRDALVVWPHDGVLTLIDGHNRYGLCMKHRIDYEIVEREFESREDVIVWMVRNQLARRNLTDFARIEIVKKLGTVNAALKAKAKANSLANLKQGAISPDLANLPSRENVSTRAELAALAGVSERTYAKGEGVIEKAPRFVIEKARNGDISTHRAEELTKSLAGADTELLDVVERYDVEDPATITLLTHLQKKAPDTFDEVKHSGHVQVTDDTDAVPITAPSAIVYKAVEKKSQAHKQIATDMAKQARYEARTAVPERLSGPLWQLLPGDLREQMQQLDANSIDAIITDPPYPQEYLPLYGVLAQEAARVLKPGGILLAMCGQSYLPQIISLMDASLTYHWTLAYLTEGGQSPQIWPRKVNTFWKPILWYVNGSYDGDWHGDVIKSERNEKDAHHWQQSISGMADLIHKFTLPDQLILDPFCGSGTTGLACITQHRRFIGIDVDPSALAAAEERLSHV